MEALHPLFLIGQDEALEAARVQALLLRRADGKVLIRDIADGRAVAIGAVIGDRVMLQRRHADRRVDFLHAFDRRIQAPMLEDALFRVGRMRLGAQDLALLRRHGQRQVRKQRAVEIIHQLLIGHVGIVLVAAFRPQLALGFDNGLPDIAGAALVIGGIDAPGLRRLSQSRRRFAAFKILARRRLVPLHPHGIVA